MDDIGFNSEFGAEVITPAEEGKLKIGGHFKFECFDPDGTLVWTEECDNGVTTAALDDINNVYFGAGTQKTTWYAGLIDNASFSALQSSDTMSSHSGWIENAGYSNANRPTWGVGASSGNVITNASAMSFNINATVTIRGAFLVSNNTISGTSGVLWATGTFGSNQSLVNGQVLRVTYTLTSSGS
jgi:hypothetical protein